MHPGSHRLLLSLLIVGMWSTGCGGGAKATSNHPPSLTGPTAQASEASSGAEVALSVEATDPDGDSLTYTWTQNPPSPAGSFSDGSSATTRWTAPQVTVDTSFLLGVIVSDGKGGTAHNSVAVLVHPVSSINHDPVIATGTPTASPTSIVGAAPVQLSVTASDADGDSLGYSWSQTPAQPAGTFNDSTVANPTWTAPIVAANQRFTLTVTVSDPQDSSVQGTVDVDVAPPVPQNTAPVLASGPSASATTIDARQSVNLSVSATDADGDPLTYTWTQTPASPAGTFNSSTSATPTWTAPQVTADTAFQLAVTVSDGKGGTVSGTVSVNVRAPANQPPTVAATISGPSTLIAGDSGVFSITASDPDGDPLTYSWTQTSPATMGTFVGGTTGASTQWFSPAVSTQTSFTLSVSVTDGHSTPVVRTLSVPVTVPHYTDVQSLWGAVPCTGCHGTNGGLSLRSGVSYGNLVNVTANACGPLVRVAPGDPDNSAIILKMEGTACGSRMPTNNPTYFDQNPGMLIRVRSWILAGAINN